MEISELAEISANTFLGLTKITDELPILENKVETTKKNIKQSENNIVAINNALEEAKKIEANIDSKLELFREEINNALQEIYQARNEILDIIKNAEENSSKLELKETKATFNSSEQKSFEAMLEESFRKPFSDEYEFVNDYHDELPFGIDVSKREQQKEKKKVTIVMNAPQKPAQRNVYSTTKNQNYGKQESRPLIKPLSSWICPVCNQSSERYGQKNMCSRCYKKLNFS